MSELVGHQELTDDAAIAASGQAVAIYGVDSIITDGEATSVVLYDGTSADDTKVLTIVGDTNFGGAGIVFGSGCFVATGANVTSLTVLYKEV